MSPRIPGVEVHTYVLIVGAGPTGLMAAVTLARYGVQCRIIDRNSGQTKAGHASGSLPLSRQSFNRLQILIVSKALQPRTQEILQTLDLLEGLKAKGNRMSEVARWAHDSTGKLARSNIRAEITSCTPFPYVLVTDQGNVEAAFESNLELRCYQVDRLMELVHYEYDMTPGTIWPIIAYVRNNSSGVIELWHTKYILGCDGAFSLVRHVESIQWRSQGGFEMWAVADLWAETDFPDIRRHCNIWSPHGNCILLPNKENGFRVYTQLGPAEVSSLNASGANFARTLFPESNSTLLFEILQARIRAILAPFTMDIIKVAWISRYSVHPGMATQFSSRLNNIFLLGDACQQYSPYLGQGTNPGIADAYNLTWKLALVIKGHATPELLDTYGIERKHFANEVGQIIKSPTPFPPAGADKSPGFESNSEKNRDLMSGCGQFYLGSALVQYPARYPINQKAEKRLTPGKRLHTMTLTRHVDGTVVDLLEEMPSTGKFHLLVFAGWAPLRNLDFKDLCSWLASPESPLSAVFPSSPFSNTGSQNSEFHSVSTEDGSEYLDLYLIHNSDHLGFEVGQLPGCFDSSKIFEDVGGVGHKTHGVCQGMTGQVLALVRPDGYIAMVTHFTDARTVMQYLKSFMIFAPVDSSPSTQGFGSVS